MERESKQEKERDRREDYMQCVWTSLCIRQDTYMRMARIGSLVSCSGTKKGSGMEKMELNKEKCG